MSPRADLAQRILKSMAEGVSVSAEDAFQLRNWSSNTRDAMGTLEEIARHILEQEHHIRGRSEAGMDASRMNSE
jgi:hypothetical protein